MITTVKTKVTHTGATEGNIYYYKVRAIDADGNPSEYSDVVCIKAVKPVDAPMVISSVNSNGKPVLTWEAVDGAVKYEAYRAFSEDGPYTRMITTSNLKVTHTGATSGKTYYYKVRALDAEGNPSEYSNIVTAVAN
jgi:fibronectin type 3 domain-containing protein